MPGKGAILSFKQVLMGGLFFSVSFVSFQALFIPPPPNMLIKILFQEDNISGTIYSMYRAGEVSVHRACCERATQPYSLGVGGYDLSSLKTSRFYHKLSENGNRVFTHSLDVN